ncbi:MAG: hypothetical protein QXF35_00315 [Candidatus Bilamarchaeaceae archaeon]
MRGFIFSLDAFVAFILALVAVYTLIFFSSVPSAYYFVLTQAHYLSRDALISSASTPCSVLIKDCSGSVLDLIVSADSSSPIINSVVQQSIGKSIPNQFGYKLEKKSGDEWVVIYDTSLVASDPHAKSMKKLQASTTITNIGLFSQSDYLYQTGNPYLYNSCKDIGASEKRVITCGNAELLPPDDSKIAPAVNSTLVRLTVFI